MRQPSRAALLILLIVLPPIASGCGTVVSLFNEPGPYSGVKADARLLTGLFGGGSGTGSGSCSTPIRMDGVTDGRALLAVLAIYLTAPIWVPTLIGVDMVLSAVADTLILPFMMRQYGFDLPPRYWKR